MELLGEVVAWFTAPERWSGRGGIPFRLVQHLTLAVVPTLIAAALAVPSAAWLAHRRRAEFLANTLVNVGRAVPSFGILVVAVLLAIRWGMPFDFWPIVVALIALALPPIFANAYAGVRGADPAAVEASRGMGLTERQVLLATELPMAAPVLLAGVRIAFVQVIATVPLAAIVGSGGGFGRYVVDGFAIGAGARDRILGGVVLIALLTAAVDLAMTLLERALLPHGVRRLSRRDEVDIAFVAS